MSAKIEYKLTNITKWPGVVKGKHKHGFIIAINRKNVHVGKHIVVSEMSEALEGMQAKKWLKIESIKDRHVLVKEQVAKTELKNQEDLKDLSKKNEQAATEKVTKIKNDQKQEIEEFNKTLTNPEPSHSLDKDAMKASAGGNLAPNRAQVSDGEQEGNDPLDDIEQPTDLDGEPNFVVKAPNHRTGRQHNQRKN